MLRERMSRMCQASLRINESLDFETVLRGVVDSARSLTDAMYGMITLFDDVGQVRDCVTSGLTPPQVKRMWLAPERPELVGYFSSISETLRVRDVHSHVRSLGLPEFKPQMQVSAALSFLVVPIRHRGESVGTFYLAEKEAGGEFTLEDEETLVMFASQAALVITNARRYRGEQRARADLEALIKTSPVGVAVFDANTGEVISFNREAVKVIEGLRTEGCKPEQLLKGMTVRRADGREVSLEQLSVAEVLDDGESVRAEEVVFEVPDGRRVNALINATPIRSDEGVVESLVVTLQNLSPMEELEQQRAEFLAIVSHDLRGPLAAIKGSATTVLGDTLAVERAEMVQLFHVINEHADQMREMINDLLDVARIRTGTLQVIPEPTQVTSLVDEARNTYLSGGGRDNLEIALKPDLPAVNADRRRISQVIVNLLSNAGRHSPSNSPIRITASQDGVYVAFSVIDKGRGVSPERLPHLFRKNDRLDDLNTHRDNSGAGWGLAICRGIVEAHGGRIWAESDGLGSGTRVTFTVPIAEGAGYASPISATGNTVRARHERTRILVVDDDPQTLRSVRETIAKAGYVPLVTADPDEVPRLLKEYRPELVLMDLVLPGTDGIEVMQTIFRNAEVPVVFLSAYGHDEAIARALEAGAVDYVVKPFSHTELVARIGAALRRNKTTVQDVPDEQFAMGELAIDYTRRRVTVAGRTIRLTDIEYRLLVELSINVGAVQTYEVLMQNVWGKWQSGDTGRIRFALANIRRKLGDDATDPTYLFNEPRVGYRLGKIE